MQKKNQQKVFFLKQQKVKDLLCNDMSDQICTATNEIKRLQTSFLTDCKKKLHSHLRARLCMSINLISMLEIHSGKRSYMVLYINTLQ